MRKIRVLENTPYHFLFLSGLIYTREVVKTSTLLSLSEEQVSDSGLSPESP